MSRTVNNSTIARHVPMPPRKSRLGRKAKPRVEVKTDETKEVPPRVQRQRLIRRLDKYTSLIVRKLYGPACIVCGSTEQLTNGHLFSRRSMSTRFDIKADGNCQPQCWPCNQAHRFDRDPYTFAFVDKHGSDAHAAVRDRYYRTKKYSLLDLQRLADGYRQLLKDMRGGIEAIRAHISAMV